MNKAANLPDHFNFGGGLQETQLTVLTGVVIALAVILILTVPRRYVIFPFLLAGLLVPGHQALVIGGAHLQVIRIAMLAGCIRIVAHRLSSGPVLPAMNILDKVFISWAFSNAIAYSILWGPEAVSNRVGFLFTTLAGYCIARYAIQDRDDLITAMKALVLAVVAIGAGMVPEFLNGKNLFDSVFGGLDRISDVRGGHFRAHGPFLHAIIAGTVGAALLPFWATLWRERHRMSALAGFAGSSMMIVSASSSTPLMTALAAVGALFAWPMRSRMRSIRWGIVGALAVTQLFMTAPIWWVLARLSGKIGGSGWHRAELIDQFLRRPGEWWLVGTQNSANWGSDTWDGLNAFVRAGVDGGLLTFVLFMAIVITAYKMVGRSRILAQNDQVDERLMWSMGACLFAHTVAFFGILYFDQSIIIWYLLLAMISATAASIAAKQNEEIDTPEDEELQLAEYTEDSSTYAREVFRDA